MVQKAVENPCAGVVAMDREVSTPIGAWLRARRKALDLTQEQLADRILLR
jgi:hypothetical protein